MGALDPRGTLHPSDRPRPHEHPSELVVWRAQRDGLPARWLAYHSLGVRHDRGREGEGDFLVADPERGWVALEVKGGELERVGGHWLQSGRPMKKQALRFAGLLHRAVLERCGLDVPFGVGC